ncbi:MAG: extracellular solute-binding protein [Lachnospiraceae bacterium]|nr:extracellular solute-binding protein [Lachnospiraceae bacterium]
MKKKVLATLLAASMILGLTACGSGASNAAVTETGDSKEAVETEVNAEETTEAAETAETTEAAETAEVTEDGTVNLRMAWWGSQTRHDITVEVIEMYEKEHPNVHIDYEFYDFDSYFTKLKTLVASDQVWDIFQLGGNFPEYIDKIYYMNEFIDNGTVDTSGISDAYLKITQDTEGNQIGLSNGLNTYGIAYDVDMFNEAGVPLPTQDWTWDDFKDAAMKIHEHTGNFGSSGFTSSEFIAGCSTYIAQQGNVGEYGFFNLDLDGMGFDDAQMLTPYIRMRADLISAGASPDAGAEMEITDIENDFLVTGEAAMTWVAVNQFPTIYDICAEEGRTLALAPVPRVKKDGPSGTVIQSSQMLCVSKDSQYKEEAARFISWFQNSTECNAVLRGERGIPINDDVRKALEAEATDGQKEMYDYVTLVGTFETPEKINVLSPAGQDEVVDNYRNYIQQVVAGDITAEEAADKTYEDACKLFE